MICLKGYRREVCFEKFEKIIKYRKFQIFQAAAAVFTRIRLILSLGIRSSRQRRCSHIPTYVHEKRMPLEWNAYKFIIFGSSHAIQQRYDIAQCTCSRKEPVFENERWKNIYTWQPDSILVWTRAIERDRRTHFLTGIYEPFLISLSLSFSRSFSLSLARFFFLAVDCCTYRL